MAKNDKKRVTEMLLVVKLENSTYRIRCHKSASYSGAISQSETYKL
jgi:hypothetical protein